MEELTTSSSILSLPDEILIMILRYTTYADCNSFRRTCKQYSELMKSSNSLWKAIYFNTANAVIYRNTESSGDWQSKLKKYLTLKNSLIQMIASMSLNQFGESHNSVILDDIKEFFNIALSSNTNYYCVIAILQEFIKTAYKKINTYHTKRPYTLTEIYYSKSVLRYLFHMLLTLKWTQYKLTNQLTPCVVLNFFTQWVDPTEMHRDEEALSSISVMIKDVDSKLLIEKNNKSRLPGEDTENTCPHGFYSEKQVMAAISHYMYKERRMVLMEAYNQATLCIVETIKSNTGSAVSLGAIFQAIAEGFGITSLTLITLPHHNTYLVWRPNGDQRDSKYYINLKTGELRLGGRCPFTSNPDPRSFDYSPEALLEYIITYYMNYMGLYVNWCKSNANYLLMFITNSPSNSYCDFKVVQTYLQRCDRKKLLLPFSLENLCTSHPVFKDTVSTNKNAPRGHDRLHVSRRGGRVSGHDPTQRGRPLGPEHGLRLRLKRHTLDAPTVHKEHLNFVSALVKRCMRNTPPPPRPLTVKMRSGSLAFCVGMICYQMVHDYICVIRGWDIQYSSSERQRDQRLPQHIKYFYNVTAVDQSDRYISQDHLQVVQNPSRIFHLEDIIAEDFTHFNGFFYEPNAAKQLLYPDDMAVGMAYTSKKFNPRVSGAYNDPNQEK